MIARPPRVAFFADSFHEVNGAALTCRQFQAFALRRGLPFLSIHSAQRPNSRTEGSVEIFEARRSPVAIPVDSDLRFDPLFYRWRRGVEEHVRQFQPDIIHLTSCGDWGILGAIIAGITKTPLALSWHTNVHSFASRRLRKTLAWTGESCADRVSHRAEGFVLDRLLWFYGRGDVLLAPNSELVHVLHERTGKPVVLMGRGIDTQLFSPARRTRRDDALVLGYVGRLMPEKNVRLLADVEQSLRDAGIRNFRFLIVGGGDEREWLEANMKQAEFPGVLREEALAEAYANMDLFLFPSHTDTYGNVIREAAASGVPAIVTASGGPKFLVAPGTTGLIAESDADFVRLAAAVVNDRPLLDSMKVRARQISLEHTWDNVFERVYDSYSIAIAAFRRAAG